MAILTIPQLKSLWIDGFVPDENDYIDLFDTIEAIAGAATVALGQNQLAFGNASGDLTGDDAFSWDGDNFIIQGSGVDRFIRMAESAGAFNGGFIQMEGATNKFHLGVHDANDADPLNDTKVITILRSNGNVGVGTENPTEAFEVVGSIKVDGALIAPTFTDIPNRLAVGNPSFGGSRLGDAALQSETIDVKVLTFKGDNQETTAAFFVNASGDTMTIRSGANPIRVNDFAPAPFDIGTESGESTIANSIEDNGGGRYINDQGVQHYVTNGSVVAQSSFQVLQNTGGLTRIKHWVGRYDGATYDRAYEIGTDNVVTFDYPIKAPDGVAANDVATVSQLTPYSEGAFSPTIIDLGGGATYTVGNHQSRYVRVGNMWVINIRLLNISTTGTPSGNVVIQLPNSIFSNFIANPAFQVCQIGSIDQNFYSIVGRGNVSSRNISLIYKDALNGSLTSILSSATITGTLELSGSFTGNF